MIAADFRCFHLCLLRDEALLGSADRLARHEELSAIDEELLETYGVAIREKPEKAESADNDDGGDDDSEARTGPEHQIGRAHSELQSLMRISYAVFCLKKKKNQIKKRKEQKIRRHLNRPSL